MHTSAPDDDARSRATTPPSAGRPAEFTVRARPLARRLITFWTASLVVGAIWTIAVTGQIVPVPLPLILQLLVSAAALWVVVSWVSVALRLRTVLRISERGLTVERDFPALRRIYAWSELREWRVRATRRGQPTLRLTFADGTRLTLYPRMFLHAHELQNRLETALPGHGTRIRVGAARDSAAPAT